MVAMDMLVGGSNNDVWDDRWEALKKTIDTMFNDYGQVSDAPRLKTLRPLLLCLKAFAGKRYTDFHGGFLDQRLETWPDFPPDAVLSVFQDQIGFDIAAIDRAILQRTSGTSLMKERLALADRIAWSALQLAVNAGLLPAGKSPTVVTYFQKSPDIRVIHYAPVALIGVPYSAQQLDQDLLATPHEVGHYVFGHGIYNGQPLRKYLVTQLQQIPGIEPADYRLLLRWLEEIFADVYGMCVAGPVMALDFQDLQLHADRQRFITDDRDHPVPVLRPEIHLQILRKRDSGRWGDWADVLDRNWQMRLIQRERIDHINALDPVDRTSHLDSFASDGRNVTVAQTVSDSSGTLQDAKPLDKLVTVMLAVLNRSMVQPWNISLPAAPTIGVDSLDLAALSPVTEELYTAFHDFLYNQPAVDPAKLDPLLTVPLNTPADQNAVVAKWLDDDQLMFPQGSVVPREMWEPYFDADGWTVEGPQQSWP